jgi:hypothetical protein
MDSGIEILNEVRTLRALAEQMLKIATLIEKKQEGVYHPAARKGRGLSEADKSLLVAGRNKRITLSK